MEAEDGKDTCPRPLIPNSLILENIRAGIGANLEVLCIA